jgi:hypothetical protein
MFASKTAKDEFRGKNLTSTLLQNVITLFCQKSPRKHIKACFEDGMELKNPV